MASIIILILLVGIGIFFTISNISKSNKISPNNSGSTANSSSQNPNTIEISSSGFNPQTLTIQKGETLVFKAVDSSNRWPASDIHPTHKAYPGSDIQKCFEDGISNIFDSCGGLSEGSSFEFIFDEVGNWKYHDHLQPGKKGTIIVQ